MIMLSQVADGKNISTPEEGGMERGGEKWGERKFGHGGRVVEGGLNRRRGGRWRSWGEKMGFDE